MLQSDVIQNRKRDKLQKRITRIIIFILTALIMVGLFYMCHTLTEVVHDKEGTIFFSGAVIGYIVLLVFLVLSGFIVAWTLFAIRHHIANKSTSEIKGALKAPMCLFGVLFVLMLPFLVLGFDNYVVITDKHVYYSQFWTLGEKEYSWEEDISHISVQYNRASRSRSSSGSVSYQYVIHFNDGKQVDVWSNVWDGTIENIKLIDEVALQHHIPFNVESRPTVEKIEEAFEGKYVEFARALFTR